MSEISHKPSLPPGWKVHVSKSYPGRIYYFNELTGVTSWECPELISPHKNDSFDKITSPKMYNSSSVGVKHNNMKIQQPTIRSQMEQVTVAVRSSTSCVNVRNNQQTGRKRKVKQNTPWKEDIFYNSENISFNTDTSQNISSNDYISLKSADKSSTVQTAVVAPVQKKVPIPMKMEKTLPANQIRKKVPPASMLTAKISQTKLSSQDSQSSKTLVRKKRLKRFCSESAEKNFKQVKISSEDKKNSSSQNAIYQDRPTSILLKNKDIITEKVSPSNTKAPANAPTKLNIENSYCSDVEMLDVSSDIELGLDSYTPEPMIIDDLNSYYIVVDTNILISHLKQIDELKDTPLEECGPPHIYIPWIVVRELDGLKKSSKTNTSRSAMEATRYLFTMLKSKHPRFHSQTPEEASKAKRKKSSESNDDVILQCCLNIADKVPIEKIILLTNDENLKLKSVIREVVVHNYESLMKSLKPDVKIRESFQMNGNESNSKKVRQGGLEEKDLELSKALQEKRKKLTHLIDADNSMKRAVDNIICQAKNLTKSFLEDFYVREMTSAYQDTWTQFQNAIEPPFILVDILRSILRHWKTVFGLVLPKTLLKDFEVLQCKFKLSKGFLSNEKELSSVLYSIDVIANAVQNRCPEINVPLSQFAELKYECQQLCQEHLIIDSNICDTVSPTVLPVLDFIWSLTNKLCGMIMDFYKIPHSFIYVEAGEKPSQQAFQELFTNLFPSVHLMKQHMSSIFQSQSEDVFKKFHKSLVDFIPSLQIQASLPPCPDFTRRTLKTFCCNPQSKVMLENGYAQLCNFHSKLNEALEYVTKSK